MFGARRRGTSVVYNVACSRHISAMRRVLLVSTVCYVAACNVVPGPRSRKPQGAIAMDLHSHAEPNRVRAQHVSLDLTLDFAARQVRGTSTVSFERLDPAAP